MLMSPRAQFALKDPGALTALLNYDWRARRVLTDAEAVGADGHEAALCGGASTGVLRQLQRLRWIGAIHGVRPHGGRMRLWPLRDMLKAQIALDLRNQSGLKLARCLEALIAARARIDPRLDAWQDWIEAGETPAFPGDGDMDELAASAGWLAGFADASIAGFVVRARFEEVEPPAFLL